MQQNMRIKRSKKCQGQFKNEMTKEIKENIDQDEPMMIGVAKIKNNT